MDILFVSALSSKRIVDLIHEKTGLNPGYAVQKFCRLIVQGLGENATAVKALSVPSITRRESKTMWVNLGTECEDGIIYRYVPFINIPLIKHICIFFYTFYYVLRWGSSGRREKAVICDVLSISVCVGALLATKVNRIRSVAIVTDIYSQMVGEKARGLNGVLSLVAGRMQQWYTSSFTHYVLLTEYMNDIVNPHHRPYIVMEAICDSKDNNNGVPKEDVGSKTIMYAGGIEEEYGLRSLVEGFVRIPREDISLVLYGHGTYVEKLKQICKQDKRVVYKGIAPNDEIMAAERSATLLVNPRFTTEEFAKYSFPSKNMEYMVSGTPVLTTILPGMPREYYSYVYLFNNGETAEGFAQSIEEVLAKPQAELENMGRKARVFVLREKNNIVQTKRIVELIKV